MVIVRPMRRLGSGAVRALVARSLRIVRSSGRSVASPGWVYTRCVEGLRVEQHGPDVLLFIKAVPGASGNEIGGLVGTRLKVRISAPPEAGKANKAVCRLIAKALGVKARAVTIHTGHTHPDKTLRIAGVSCDEVRRGL